MHPAQSQRQPVSQTSALSRSSSSSSSPGSRNRATLQPRASMSAMALPDEGSNRLRRDPGARAAGWLRGLRLRLQIPAEVSSGNLYLPCDLGGRHGRRLFHLHRLLRSHRAARVGCGSAEMVHVFFGNVVGTGMVVGVVVLALMGGMTSSCRLWSS